MSADFAGSLKSLRGKSLSSSIVDMISNHLLSGELKPGDKLPTELEFAARLGVGRNSVREAIKMLSSLGVIEIKRGSGTFIARSMSPSIVNSLVLSLVFQQRTPQELIELRLLLDSGSAELAMEKIQDSDLRRLEAANHELKLEAEKNNRNLRKIRDLDLRFHELLYQLSGNSLLARISGAIYTLFAASIEKTVASDPLTGYHNHKLIIQALSTRDPEKVRDAMRESLSVWMDLIADQES